MLSPELQSEILSLHFGKKKGIRAIARELRVTRKTVAAVIARRSVAMAPSPRSRGSILDPFKPEVEALLQKDPGIPVHTLLERIRNAGYTGGYTVLRQWVSAKRTVPHRPREAYLRLDFAAGECAQVDWGEFGDVFGDGVKIHCFLMVLCYSRLLYIEFTRSEKFEDFIRCHENAFTFFGGLVPQECWYDNLTSAVTDRMGSLIRFNARFLAYMGHHGIRPHACNPARGNEKGRVEDGVKYVRSSFWPGRRFSDFDDLCVQASKWRDETANRREHRSTRKIPILFYEAEEKKAMRPKNNHAYDCAEVFSRVVPPQFHIHYDTNRYSVPWTLVGLAVTVRVTEVEIVVYYHERFVTRHLRSFQKHKTITQSSHVDGLLERKPGASRDGWQLQAVKAIGPAMKRYLDFLRSGHRSLRSEVSKILALATVYGETEVNHAAGELLDAGIVGVDNLELALKGRCNPDKRLAPQPLSFPNQKLNRVVPTVDLRRYDALLFESAHHQCPASNPGVKDNGNCIPIHGTEQ